MKMNTEFQFLMKCLSVYDFVSLSGALIAFGPEYFRWILGFGYDRNTAYLYVERASYYGLYRLGGSMSFWTIAVLTVQRFVHFVSILGSKQSFWVLSDSGHELFTCCFLSDIEE